MPELPAFQTIEEAATWAETHDTAPYFDEMEDVPPFQVERPRQQQARLSLYLSQDAFAKLRALARQKQLDYRTLAEAFIVDRLLQEA
jgi:hypothetical protein